MAQGTKSADRKSGQQGTRSRSSGAPKSSSAKRNAHQRSSASKSSAQTKAKGRTDDTKAKGRTDDGEQENQDRKNDRDGGGQAVKSSHIIEEHIDVGVPNETAFEQWTNYDDFSKWTKAETAKADDKDAEKVDSSSKIGPSRRTWESEVVEQVPGRRIAWRSVGGAQNVGVVTFHKLDDRLTRIMVEMEYHPSGFMESVGNFFRMQRRRVRKDLKLYKNFVELNGEAEGGAGKQRVRGPGLKEHMDDRANGKNS